MLGVACSLSLPERTPAASPSVNRPTDVFSIETPSPTTETTRTPAPTKDKSLTPTPSPTIYLMATHTPTFSLPPASNLTHPTLTYIDSPIPDGLQIAYITQDTLYLWKESQTFKVVTRPNISRPLLSTDGQWIIFQQYQPDNPPPCCAFEVWAIGSDGSDLHRLLSLNDLAGLAVDDQLNFLDQIAWVPGRHELLFSTEHTIEGPPGVFPTLDLYLLDLAGQVTPLIEPGQGGWSFVPAPTGQYAVLVDSWRISRVDLQSGDYRTLLEFKVVGMGTDFPFRPTVVWDPNGRYIMTWIPPENLYRLDYKDEPVQLWRLFMAGAVEQVYQRPAFQPFTFSLSSNLRYLFYVDRGCVDAQLFLHIRDLVTGKEQSRYCVWNFPRWAPDSETYFFWDYGKWHMGNVFDSTVQPLDFFSSSNELGGDSSRMLSWINDSHFLFRMNNQESCIIYIATVEGVVAEIVRAHPDSCPMVDYSLQET